MPAKKDSKGHNNKDTATRVRSIKERMLRIGIKRVGYRIENASSGRITVGNDGKETDSHTVHLARRR
jgi:hypothetical protein